MVDAHGQTTQQLMTIAQSKGVTPDATPPQMAQDQMTALNAARPARSTGYTCTTRSSTTWRR